MTIYAFDVETYEERNGLLHPVLDCTQFTIGAIRREGKQKTDFYNTKEEMWAAVKELAQAATKRNKVYYLYAHNAKYDFYAIADLNDKDMKIVNHEPLIVSVMNNGREGVRILDSMSIWNTNLKKIGEMLKRPKLEMPKEIRSKEELKTYLEQDTIICLESILEAKKLLKEANITVRRLLTIGQIANNNFLRLLKTEITSEEFKEGFFADKNSNTVWKSQYPELIREAYRGATVHAKTGKYRNVNAYDFNGLYQEAAKRMKFPELKSEEMIKEPLTNKKKEEILSQIGISRAIVRNNTNKHGLLQIRTAKNIAARGKLFWQIAIGIALIIAAYALFRMIVPEKTTTPEQTLAAVLQNQTAAIG